MILFALGTVDEQFLPLDSIYFSIILNKFFEMCFDGVFQILSKNNLKELLMV